MHKQALSREAWIGLLSGVGGLGVGGYAGMKLERLRGRISALEGMVKYPEIMIGQLPAKRKKQASYLAKLAIAFPTTEQLERALSRKAPTPTPVPEFKMTKQMKDRLMGILARMSPLGAADHPRAQKALSAIGLGAIGAGVGIAGLGAYAAYKLLKKKKKSA